MATTPNYGFVMPDSTDLVKDLPADFATFGNAVDGQMYTNANAAINKTLIDAKGDLIAGSAADTAARLAVGANGYALVADSTQTTGLTYKNLVPDQTSNSGKYLTTDGTNTSWGTISSGGLTLISEQTASNASSISFSSIPSTYKNLILTFDGCYMSGVTASDFGIRFNSSSSANYQEKSWGYYQTASANDISASTGVCQVHGYAFRNIENTTLSNNNSGTLYVYNYASTSKTKHYNYWHAQRNQSSQFIGLTIDGTWNDTSAITSIDIYRVNGNQGLYTATNCSFRLYGEA